jgi:hypothetical protein
MDVSSVTGPAMPTLRTRPARFRPAEMACALVLLVAALTFVTAPPGSTATGTVGPVNVSVTPSVGLADGQTVSIHAEATGGAELFEIRAHVCSTGAISNFVDFGYQGPYCVAQGGIAQGGLNGDYETGRRRPRVPCGYRDSRLARRDRLSPHSDVRPGVAVRTGGATPDHERDGVLRDRPLFRSRLSA